MHVSASTYVGMQHPPVWEGGRFLGDRMHQASVGGRDGKPTDHGAGDGASNEIVRSLHPVLSFGGDFFFLLPPRFHARILPRPVASAAANPQGLELRTTKLLHSAP